MKKPCQGLNRHGLPCQSPAMLDGDFCAYHAGRWGPRPLAQHRCRGFCVDGRVCTQILTEPGFCWLHQDVEQQAGLREKGLAAREKGRAEQEATIRRLRDKLDPGCLVEGAGNV